MHKNLCEKITCGITNHDDYFIQKADATGRLEFSTIQKVACAIRQLAYGTITDLFDDTWGISESTSIENLKMFSRAIYAVYGEECLRSSTASDLYRLLAKDEKRGFPGSLNDLDVLAKSPLFDDVCQGRNHQVDYEVNGRHYGNGYYLVDGIYPRWGTFVNTISNLGTPQHQLFAKMQEAYQKDVERAFGILQARWDIVRGPARGWHREDLSYIMMTCVILHNMIAKDEHDEDELVDFDPYEIPNRPSKAQIYERPTMETDMQRNGIRDMHGFKSRYQGLKCQVISRSLQKYLVQHLWNKKVQEDGHDENNNY